MFNTSTLYKNLSHSGGREWNVKAHVILSNATTLDLDNNDFMEHGISLEDGTSAQGTFTVGGAVIKEISLLLNNFRGKFTEYDFNDAIIYPYVGLTVQNHYQLGKIIEWIPLGKFTVDEPKSLGSTIRIIALDNMSKFDKAYSSSKLTYPATLAQIVADACVKCGVTNSATTFTNSNYIVTTKPTDSSITFREIVSYAAQLAGCFARINRDGALEFRWYDFDRFTIPLPEGKQEPAEFRKSSNYNIGTSDITITGVQIIPQTSDGHEYIHGADGYVVKIESNPLAQNNLQSLVDSIGAKIVGMTFTPYTVTTYADPSLDCGDVVLVTDKKGVVHKSFISSASYQIGSFESFTADAETLSKNQSTRFTKADKAQESADNANKGVEEAKAEITTTNGQVALKASKASLISEINICPEAIKINTTRLDVSGLVTISGVEDGTTEINGGCIRTGRVESKNGDWWLDLESGQLYLSNGTFKGIIIFGTDGYLKQDSTTGKIIFTGGTYGSGIEIDGGNGGIRLKTGGTTGGVTECDDLACSSLSIGGNYIPTNGYTGNVGITRSDGTTRTLHFTSGILDDNNA